MSHESKQCPECGGEIPQDAPQGLCPACLIAGAAAPTGSDGMSSKHEIPPSPIELAAVFPHLEIIGLIGQGGMGFVYQARQPRLDRWVALKVLPRRLSEDPRFSARFAREGRLLAKLNHPGIVAIHDFGVVELPSVASSEFESESGTTPSPSTSSSIYYLLMEYVDGVNLRQAMRASRFSPSQALAIVPCICEALQYAHDEGVLHRDIKPENILLDAKGRVKIADFGIAKLMGEGMEDGESERLGVAGGESARHITHETVLGTPQYMAPEQIEQPGKVDHRADIYSLGVVFYELLTGELPVGKFAPPSAKTELDERVDQIVLRALTKERKFRHQSAREMKTEVETAVRERANEGQASAVEPPDIPPTMPSKEIEVNPWPRRIFILVIILALVPFLFLGTVILSWFAYRTVRSSDVMRPTNQPTHVTVPMGAMELETMSPVIVQTEPVSGSVDVSPGVLEIVVRFSKPMDSSSWSWLPAWDDSMPDLMDPPKFEADGRTCVIRVRVEPGKPYGCWLNSEDDGGFRDLAGQSAVPYLLVFETEE